MSQTRRAGRGRRLTPTTLLTRLGPLPARRVPEAPLRAGGLPRVLPPTSQTGHGSTPTRSGNTRRRTRGGGWHRRSGTRQRRSTGTGSSRKRRARNCIPLLTGPPQAEKQPGKVLQLRLGLRAGAARNRRSRLHPQPTVAAILGGTLSLHMIPATLPWLPTSLP